MTSHASQSLRRKRFLPGLRWRYSLRLVLLAMTLSCLVAGMWTNYAADALQDVGASTGWPPTVVAPFVLRTTKDDNFTVRQDFHLWCFGSVIDWPWHFATPTPEPVIFTVQPRIILQPPLHSEESLGLDALGLDADSQ